MMIGPMVIDLWPICSKPRPLPHFDWVHFYIFQPVVMEMCFLVPRHCICIWKSSVFFFFKFMLLSTESIMTALFGPQVFSYRALWAGLVYPISMQSDSLCLDICSSATLWYLVRICTLFPFFGPCFMGLAHSSSRQFETWRKTNNRAGTTTIGASGLNPK